MANLTDKITQPDQSSPSDSQPALTKPPTQNSGSTAFNNPLQKDAALKHLEQGKLLIGQGNPSAAINCFKEAIRLQPDYLAAYNQLGNAYQQLGRTETAIATYQKLLSLNPNVAQVHCNLGTSLQLQGKTEEAIAAYQQAVKIKPDFALAYLNLSRLYAIQGALPEAAQALREVLRLQPNSAVGYFDLANLMRKSGNIEAAFKYLEQSLVYQPNFIDAMQNLGCLWMIQGHMDKAQACFQKVLKQKPDHAPVLGDLAHVLEAQGKITQAIACYNRALSLQPEATPILYNREHARLTLCDWSDYPSRMQHLQERIQAYVNNLVAPAIPPLWTCHYPLPLNLRREVTQRWSESIVQKMAVLKQRCAFTPPSAPAPKLRLGYVSADFRNHAVGSLISSIFQHHDRSKVEVHAYSLVDQSDEFTEAVRTGCDAFVDLSKLSTEAAARLIHDSGIHILIDLMGYTTFSRPEIFALQPAPIQVQYLGYPSTMAAPFIQYILADRWLIPPELASEYTEQVVELPHAFVASPSLTSSEQPLSRAHYGLPDDAFVYCCFNRTDKFDPEVFTSWMRILQQVTNSVLWLIETAPTISGTLRQLAQQQGIDPKRLVFTPMMPFPEYLAAYQLADLFLDTFVYNAGATAVHAISAGLPFLTCPGQAFSARMGSSVCAAAGLESLICSSKATYEQAAVYFGNHPDKLTKIREGLQANRTKLPLFQLQQWVAHLEAAFWKLYQSQVVLFCKG
jgi:predicted O-linked N-acetylglucosamine transferase (SPINDLY family)